MTQQYEGLNIPSDPAEQVRLAQMINEIVNSMVRTRAEAEHRKSILTTIKEQFDLPSAAANTAAKIMFKENLEEVKAKHDDLVDLIDVLTLARRKARIGTLNATSVSSDDGDADDSEE